MLEIWYTSLNLTDLMARFDVRFNLDYSILNQV